MSLAESLDLDLEDADFSRVRTRGRASRLPTVLSSRPLDAEEVAALGEREVGTKAAPLQRVSSRHRQLARAIASGLSPSAAGRSVGLSASRVSILMNDPTFTDLVAHSTALKDAAFSSFVEVAAGLATDAAEAIRDRLETEPESLEVDELLRISQVMADRSGNAPKRVVDNNINLNFGDALAQARQRAKAAATALIEDATVIEGETNS